MLAEKTEIDQEQLLRVANLIDRMRIKGIGQDYAELLEAAGVVTVKELRYRNPARLAEAMGRLSARERIVFEMKHYQGLKLRAIGDALGTSEETVKNSLFRATRKLRSELGALR